MNFGFENLLDELPPKTGANPYRANDGSNSSVGGTTSLNALPYALPATYTAGGLGGAAGATYDTLGRRMFLSFTMDF